MNNLLVLNILNDIVESATEQFSQTIATEDLLFSLLVAMISALIIDFIYKKTYIGVSYSKSNSLSIILLALVTSIVIRTINSNLSLSLGMVGALSIVRFRTAIKDPIDTIFMFWAITVGIMSGAGFYVVTIIATLIISIVYFVNYIFQVKRTRKMLLIVTCTLEKSKEIINMLDNKKCVLKTEMYKNNSAELTFEISDRKEKNKVVEMSDSEGIKTINVIDID